MGLLGNSYAPYGGVTSLLGIDQKAMRNQALWNGLAAAGFQLMGDKNLGNAGGAFLVGTNQARDDYYRTALDAYRLKQAEEERQYGRARDAKEDERWQMQWDYNKGRQQKADAWNNTQMGWQMDDRQRAEDMRTGQQSAVEGFTGRVDDWQQQGGDLFDTGMQTWLRGQGVQGVDPSQPRVTQQDYQRRDKMQPYMAAQDYGGAFQQMVAEPGKGNWTPVGKDSTLFNEDTGQFLTPPAQAGGGRLIDDPMKIGKDFQTQPGFERLQQIAPTVESMVRSLEDPSAMADLDFVYGLAKILDPTSVVRESEAGMVIDSQGIAPSLLGQLNRILSGNQAMLPEIRQKLVGVAVRRAEQLRQQAVKEREFYERMARENQFNPDVYLQQVPELPAVPNAALSNIPQEAVSELLADPSPQAIQEFDAAFGPGAAAAVLRGR